MFPPFEGNTPPITPPGNTGPGGPGRIIPVEPRFWPEDFSVFPISDFAFGRGGLGVAGFGIPYGDPLAQTFMLNPSSFDGEASGYLTSLDLFFSSKDARMGVTVEIRETENGIPASKVLPFSKIHLKPSQINTSTKGTAATTINFKAPVAISTNKEYCFVILPDGNSPDYKVFTAKAGQKDLNTNISVNQDWGQGTMFLSTNNRTWTENHTVLSHFNG